MVNADDFGLSEGINRGILSAFQRGILRSTSILPNGTAFDDAAAIAASTPDLDIGFHVSLVDEKCVAPVSDVHGLVDDNGCLPASYSEFVKGYFSRRFSLRDIQVEIEAQLRRVVDAGIHPTHIDSHQHLHVLPGIIDVVIQTAKDAGIPVIRIPRECGGPGARFFHRLVLSFFCKSAESKARMAGLHYPDNFFGFSVSGHMNEYNLTKTLDSLRPGVNEIMCHPGFIDPATSARYQWGYHWDDETSALCSESIRRIVEDRNIRLASFTDAFDF